MTGLGYTARAMRWQGFAAVVTVGILAGVLVRAGSGIGPHSLGAVLAGGLAAAVVLGLDDPARELLAAVPIGPARQAAQRVALGAVAALVGWCLVGASDPGSSVGLMALAALIGTGVAASLLVRRHRPDAAPAAGAGVALGWAVAPAVLGHEMLHDVATAWMAHPWTVLAGAGLVIVIRRPR